jgi:hypothetical protein
VEHGDFVRRSSSTYDFAWTIVGKEFLDILAVKLPSNGHDRADFWFFPK